MGKPLRADDRGSTTIVTAVITCFLATAVMVAVAIIGNTIASHQARNASDLAAIAGAHAVFRGDNACDKAGDVARANGGVMTRCHVEGADVTVTVDVGPSSAVSKAGPV
jgi:secretion/DNA translocation related TadE-like protein